MSVLWIPEQKAQQLSGATWLRGEISETGYTMFGDMAWRGVRAASESYGVSPQESFEYDRAGRLWRSNEGDGVVRIHAYDISGNLTLTAEPVGAGSSLSSHATIGAALGALTTPGGADYGIDDAADRAITIRQYDYRNQLTVVRGMFREATTAGGTAPIRQQLVTIYAYNAFGELASASDPRSSGWLTEYFYNSMGKLIEKRLPSASFTGENGAAAAARASELFYYDAAGREVGRRDLNGNLTTVTLVAGSGLDGEAALADKRFNPDGGITDHDYDVFGDNTSIKDPLGRQTIMTYDAMGRVELVKTPGIQDTVSGSDGLEEHFVYDGLGQRIARWNNQFGSTWKEETDYDRLGRVTRVNDYAGDETVYTHAWSSAIGTTGLTATAFGGWTRTTDRPGITQNAVETSDYFGRTVARTDFGNRDYRMTYDKAGRLTLQENEIVAGSGAFIQDTHYNWWNTGLVASITDDREGDYLNGHLDERVIASSFRYDKAGNRVYERHSGPYTLVQDSPDPNDPDHIFYITATFQEGVASYDALGRLVSVDDTGLTAGWQEGREAVSIDYGYDPNGNRRFVSFAYSDTSDPANPIAKSGSHWYKYDSMNRLTLSKGTLSGGVISRGTGGIALTWNDAGERVTAQHGPNTTETYLYDKDGHLTDTSVTVNGVASYTIDNTVDRLGRTTAYVEKQGATTRFSRTNIVYAEGGRSNNVFTETVTEAGVSNTVENSYGASGLLESVDVEGTGGSLTTYGYSWWDGAVRTSETVDPDTGATGTTTFSLDGHGRVKSASIDDAAGDRTLRYTTDQSGQVMTRVAYDGAGTTVATGAQYYYYFGGERVASLGTLDAPDASYQATVAERGSATAPPSGFLADFDQNYAPVNAANPGATPSLHIVQAGETLASIAAGLLDEGAQRLALEDHRDVGAADPGVVIFRAYRERGAV